MARKSRQDTTEETRLRLVTAARQVFVKNGYADTAMEDLTSAAGLTRGALYHHFGDKKGLLKAVAQDIEIEMDERLLAAMHGLACSADATSIWKWRWSRMSSGLSCGMLRLYWASATPRNVSVLAWHHLPAFYKSSCRRRSFIRATPKRWPAF